MKKNKTVPTIRFFEFSDAWEQHNVGDFLTVSKIPGHTGVDAKKLTVKLWGKPSWMTAILMAQPLRFIKRMVPGMRLIL